MCSKFFRRTEENSFVHRMSKTKNFVCLDLISRHFLYSTQGEFDLLFAQLQSLCKCQVSQSTYLIAPQLSSRNVHFIITDPKKDPRPLFLLSERVHNGAKAPTMCIWKRTWQPSIKNPIFQTRSPTLHFWQFGSKLIILKKDQCVKPRRVNPKIFPENFKCSRTSKFLLPSMGYHYSIFILQHQWNRPVILKNDG